MILKMKKVVSMLLIILLVIYFPTYTTHAKETESLTSENLLTLDKTELLSVLLDKGLILTEYYSEYIEVAEGFVYDYTPMIISGELDISHKPFNYDQSNEMLFNLYTVLYDLGLVTGNSINSRSTYTLQHNVTIGSWDDSYSYYNCYAYAIGKTSGLQPGELFKRDFSIYMDISAMADVVLADLAEEGYWGMKTTVKPDSLPDEYFRIIAIRKDTDNRDYHFMRPYNATLNSWTHKPGGTQPLKWNYTSPEAEIWDNECVKNGVVYEPTITYESEIYYILYKHEDDPGVQQWSIDP